MLYNKTTKKGQLMSKENSMKKLNEALEILKADRKDTSMAYVSMAGYLMALATDKQASMVLEIVKGGK